MKKGLCFFLFAFAFGLSLWGQKVLLIERAGDPHTQRIAIYEELRFQLKGDNKGWYTRQILDMDPDGQMILLGDTWTPVDQITWIWLKKQRAIANILGGALQIGGISMFLTDAWYTVSGNSQYTEGGMEFGLVNLAVGTAIRKFFSPIKYKFGKKKRLRVVDLTF